MVHILIVDDDIEILELMQHYLSQYGLHVEVARSGEEMDRHMAVRPFDALILDVMLPDEDGISLCRRIRTHSNVPIIMLTAMAEAHERILGLEIGADDYVTKPFEPRELLARIRAVLRRSSQHPGSQSSSRYHFHQWNLDVLRRELRHRDGTLVPISSGEFELLLTFLNHAETLLSRDQLLDYTKGADYEVFDRSIDVLISRLRRKIEVNPRRPEIIKTVRNVGYLFNARVRRS